MAAFKHPPRLLRFSLATLFLITAACAVGLWWWQRPYEVVSSDGRRVESLRRQLFSDPVNHGAWRQFDAEGNLLFEEHWRHGRLHGPTRRWQQPSGELALELEFDHGTLTRVDGTMVDDFMTRLIFDDSPNALRIQSALQEETKFDYHDAQLAAVIQEISFRYDFPFALDTRALREWGISKDAPITVSGASLPLFHAICAILSYADLTCAYRDEVLWVTTPDSNLFDEDQANQTQVVDGQHTSRKN